MRKVEKRFLLPAIKPCAQIIHPTLLTSIPLVLPPQNRLQPKDKAAIRKEIKKFGRQDRCHKLKQKKAIPIN